MELDLTENIKIYNHQTRCLMNPSFNRLYPPMFDNILVCIRNSFNPKYSLDRYLMTIHIYKTLHDQMIVSRT
jgi:hypothetical protein